MKLTISLFNKTQVVAGFIPEAMQIAEWFGCELEITPDPTVLLLPRGLDLWPVRTGPTVNLEIVVRGTDAAEAVQAMRLRMARSFGDLSFQLN